MHKFFSFPTLKYPKLTLLVLSYILTYLLFINGSFSALGGIIRSLGYIGAFIAGIFYAYGFTAGLVTPVIFLMAKSLNIFAAGFISGLGSLVGDLLIFEFIRVGFSDEIKELGHEKLLMKIKMPAVVRSYLAIIIGAIIIASPLPDELGVSLMAMSHISIRNFIFMDYLLNTSGILFILLLGI